MDRSDREALLYEAEHPEELPPGEELAPEVLSLRSIDDSPTGQLLAEIHLVAREGTASDVPVPPERFAAVLGLYGLGDRVLEMLPHLQAIDRGWREVVAGERKRLQEEARDRARDGTL